jgi:acyl-CoA thioester hydrolase
MQTQENFHSPANPFCLALTPKAEDIDMMGHVNNAVYVRWIQEVATAHWMAHAQPEWIADTLWIVTRHEIDYKRPAHLGDRLIGCTWVGHAQGARFDRYVHIIDQQSEQTLVEAKTTWAALDAQSRRLKRIPRSVIAHFHHI